MMELLRKVFLSGLLAISPVSPTADTYFDGFLEPLEQSGRPILMSRCRDAKGTRWFLLVGDGLPLRYAEFQASGAQTNGAVVEFRNGEILPNDLMGGLGTRELQQRKIGELLSSPFQLIVPGTFRREWDRGEIATCESK